MKVFPAIVVAYITTLILALALPGCGQKSAPKILAVGGDQLAQSIGALQKGVTALQQANVPGFTPQVALKAQETLLTANQSVSQLPPVLRAIEAGQSVTSAQLDSATKALQAAQAALSVLAVGWPNHPEVLKVMEVAKQAQQLFITTAVELGKARVALGGQ